MNLRSLCLILVFSIMSGAALAIDRRKQQDDEEISYFVYPLVYTIPGIGSGEGAGATVVNLLGGGSTLSLIQIRGDLEVDSIVVSDLPLFTRHLTLSLVYADARRGGFAFYERGPDSAQEPEFTLKFNHSWAYGAELNLNFFDRQLEFYAGASLAFPEIDLDQSDLGDVSNLENLPPEEQEEELAAFVKNFLKYINLVNLFVTRYGVYIDETDDRIDPRIGVRFQYEQYGFEGRGLTNFKVNDYSLTTYLPNDDLSSVWVTNFFYSQSEVTKPLEVDPEEFYANCLENSEKNSNQEEDNIESETLCKGIQRGFQDFIETEANNSNATSLGGPNRLRSYPVSRFHDKYSFFAGIEYRTYFLEHTTPFNFLFEKGVFEAVQLAYFYEIGQVSPTNDSALYRDFKYSTGIGLRLVFTSVVLRADYATGKEGDEVTVFIGYGF